jgi:hypothetical protein
VLAKACPCGRPASGQSACRPFREDSTILCHVGSVHFSDLDEWLRRRLRQVRWKEWKRPVTRRRNLRAFGIPDRSASRDSLTHITVSGTLSEPPGADPHAGWCERRRGEPGAYPMLLRGFQEAGDRNTACWAAK